MEIHLRPTCWTAQHHRPALQPSASPPLVGRDLRLCHVTLTVRIDIEDRNFHWETKRNSGADHHFSHCRALSKKIGFNLPAPDRRLRVIADRLYQHEAEWCENVATPWNRAGARRGNGDALVRAGLNCPRERPKRHLTATADASEPKPEEVQNSIQPPCQDRSSLQLADCLKKTIRPSIGPGRACVRRPARVRQNRHRGLSWFPDWGRTL